MSDQVTQQTPTQDSTPAQEASVQPTQPAAEKPKTEAQVAPPATQPAEVQPPAYSPDFKFRANNKDHEIPELLRAAIKDEKAEKYIKDIFQKAYGIEPIKERLNSIREEHQQLRQAHYSVMSQVQEARDAYQRNDMDTVFETLQISPEKVLQWAVQKVQLSQMPLEQRQAIENQRMAEKRAMMLEKQSSYSAQQAMEQQAQHLGQMLDLVLERPDYSAVAQAYDAKKSKPGAFRDLVIKIGESEHALSGKILTPLEAAQKALDWLGETAQPAKPAAATPPAQNAQPPAMPAAELQKTKTTLPNLANAGAKAGAAPAKAKVRTLDDLKKVYDQKYAPNQ